MEININLANHPFIDLRPMLKSLRISMAVLIGLSLAVGLATWYLHRRAEEANRTISSLEADISRLVAERQGFRRLMLRPENVRALKETEDLNQLFDAKAFSWTLVMEDLEKVLPGGVQVTAIEPTRARDGSVTLHIRVHGPRNKSIELVKNLELSSRFFSPRIVGESTDTNSNQGIVSVSAPATSDFDLLTEYNSDASDDLQPAPVGAEPLKALIDKATPQMPNASTRPTDNARIGRFKPRPALYPEGAK